LGFFFFSLFIIFTLLIFLGFVECDVKFDCSLGFDCQLLGLDFHYVWFIVYGKMGV